MNDPRSLDNAAMSREAFHGLYRMPGYRYEYLDGRARISVERSAVAVSAVRPTYLREAAADADRSTGIEIRGTHGTSSDELVAAWTDAFRHTTDYAGFSREAIRENAMSEIHGLQTNEGGGFHPASTVAMQKDAVAGALLISERTTRPSIAVIFVRRSFRRSGVGTALARRAAEVLQAGDEEVLCSRYHVANRPSAAWHAALGFIEMPDVFLARHRYRYAKHNLEAGHEAGAAAGRRVARLRAQVDALKADYRENPESVSPHSWLDGDGTRIDAFAKAHLP